MVMEKKFPLWILAALILILCVVQGVAVYWKLYFYLWWLDIPMHLFGGLWLGLSALVVYYASHLQNKDHSARFALVCALSSAFFIGVGWEVFEWGVDRINGLTRVDFVDTLSDIVNDFIGAIVAWGIFTQRGYNKQI